MISVAEHFYSLQGEGATQGIKSVFLRLKNCNLLCGGKGTVFDKQLHDGATWRCDTIEVWLKGVSYSYEKLLKLFYEHGYVDKLRDGAHLVVTGGEPLLQQDQLVVFVTQFLEPCFLEIETNGTILLCPELIGRVNQINCSPKLKNSGVEKDKRYKPDVIKQISAHMRGYFKFVISDKQDIDEVLNDYVIPLQIPPKKVFLMPAADDIQTLSILSPLVAEEAKENNFNFSNRLHIQLWNRKTGV